MTYPSTAATLTFVEEAKKAFAAAGIAMPAVSGGGIILDHGWHQLYLLLGWMREPLEAVSAVTRTVDQRHYPAEDEAHIELEFARGEGHIDLSWTASDRSNGGEIHGDEGNIAIHDDRIVVQNQYGERTFPFAGRLTQSSYHPDWFEAMIRYNVVDECREEADRNFAEAGVLVSAICAAYRSARESGVPCRPMLPSTETAAWALAQGLNEKNGSSSRSPSA